MTDADIKISVRVELTEEEPPHPPPPASRLVTSFGYGDDAVMRYLPTLPKNYNFAKLCRRNTKGATYFNERGQPFKFTPGDIEYFKAIQPDDVHIYGYTVQQKWAWLGFGRPIEEGRPYFGNNRRDLMVYGHVPFRVGASSTFYADFEFGKEESTFYEIDGFKRSMMGPLGEFVDYTYEWKYLRIVNGVEYPITQNIKTRVKSGVIPLLEAGYFTPCTEVQYSANGINGTKISATSKGFKLDIVPAPSEYPYTGWPDDKVYVWGGGVH